MRRIVAGTDADGRSVLVSDGEPVRVFRNPNSRERAIMSASEAVKALLGSDDIAIAELWATDDVPPTVDSSDPTADMDWVRDIPTGATRWRVAVMGPNRVAPIHQTRTIDYDVLLSGRLDLLLDDTEVAMEPGDFAVLGAVRHGWRAGPEGAELLVFMIGL